MKSLARTALDDLLDRESLVAISKERLGKLEEIEKIYEAIYPSFRRFNCDAPGCKAFVATNWNISCYIDCTNIVMCKSCNLHCCNAHMKKYIGTEITGRLSTVECLNCKAFGEV